MSQHKQAFFADVPGEVSRVALHALTVIVSGQNKTSTENPPRRTTPKLVPLDTLNGHLYDAVVSDDRNDVWNTVKKMQASGLSDQEIKVGSVTAIARKLGEDWVNDVATFGTVTIGCARLQSVVHHLSSDPPHTPGTHRASQKRCLIVTPENSQHTLGAVLITDQLRFAGATAKLALGVGAAALARLVQSQEFDAVMISASQGECIDRLRGLVSSARRGNSGSQVMIGGGILDRYRDLVAATGTDYVSHDVHEALEFCTQNKFLG